MSSPTPDPPGPPGLSAEAEARRPGDPTDEVLADGAAADGAAAGGPVPGSPEAPERLAEQAHRPVLVVDFGAQYAQLIARRVREARGYSEIVPHTASVGALLERKPAAIILSGGPASVYADGAPQVDPALFDAGVPVLGICYGFQAMARALGGDVAHTGLREYGGTSVQTRPAGSTLLDGQPVDQSVWMSHGDSVASALAGFVVTAQTPGTPVAAFEDDARRLYGVQWHPEVKHSTHGQQVLVNFLTKG